MILCVFGMRGQKEKLPKKLCTLRKLFLVCDAEMTLLTLSASKGSLTLNI
jgi:hypothetical protein